MVSRSGSISALFLSVFLSPATARAAEVCDEFPEVHTRWAFRVPKCGPTASLSERDGFLRITAPDGFTSNGGYDNWTNVDLAPSVERYDMGSGDWTISTRIEMETRPTPFYHVGLFFGIGASSRNELVYWGPYWNNAADNFDGALVIERVGLGFRPAYGPVLGPVSIQVEKAGDTFFFRHREDDAVDWIEDRAMTSIELNLTAEMPVTRVGVMVKTYGGLQAPLLTADFDYFCLEVPGDLPSDPVTEPFDVLTPVSGLACEKLGDGSVSLSWSACPEANTPVIVKIADEVVRTLDGDALDVVIAPPIPGGSIINVEVDNGFGQPARCTLADTLVDICDEFDEDPLASDVWTFRTPRLVGAGPTVAAMEDPNLVGNNVLRFSVPSGAMAGGAFDNWVGADLAPSLERYDMGDRDWVISTRLQYDPAIPSPTVDHHVGLMVGYGFGQPVDAFNDVLYWGEYVGSTILKLERTGVAPTGNFAYDGSPVSLQVQKAGNTLIFSHREEDTDPWITDFSYNVVQPLPQNAAASPPAGTPVSRVGLMIKTWGAAPEVIADFDYFCLKVADSPPVAHIQAVPLGGTVPLEVELLAAGSIDPSGGTMTYAWDFGDGETGAGEAVRHTFTRAGLVTVRLTATDDQNNKGSTEVQIALSDPVAPFSFDKVGDRGRTGLVTVDSSGPKPVHCVYAGGSDINLLSDSAYFLEQKLTGDFEVTAKITDGEFTPVRARVGLMARLENDPRSINLLMSVDGQNDGYQFQWRATKGANTQRPTPNPAVTPRGALPAWIRLKREGSLFIGYYSTDGTTFLEYARRDLPGLNVAELQVGLAATSGDDLILTRFCAELDGFTSTPRPPAQPTGLAATAGNLQVSLDWNDNAEPDLLGYDVYRSDAGGPFNKITPASVLASSYIDGGLTAGVEYCYKVRAVSPAGESVDSASSCATPTGGGVTFRRGDPDGSAGIDLSDAIGVLQHLFLGGAKPVCWDAADTDDNGAVDISDPIANLQYQFLGGPPPAAPGPSSCGPDVNPETPELGCDSPCA